jgi:GDP-D-mannose 3',5'-epimerase
MRERLIVTGAGGFIGHHLVTYLVACGYWVRGVDIKLPEYEASAAHEFELLDLRYRENCVTATRGVDQVYHLAADMGGIGYITAKHAGIACNNSLMNLHLLEAARLSEVKRFLFASSACVYLQYLQKDADLQPLREDDAWPADPEEGYGLEKLYMEKLCQYHAEDYGLETARSAAMMVARKRHPPPSAGRSLTPRGPARSRSGATAGRRAPSCM